VSTERYRTLTAADLAEAARACTAPGPPALVLAVRQFDEGDYFACHETLEELWRAEAGPVRRVYQGILHLAVGLYHLRRGNRHGALAKLRSGLEYLAPFPGRCQGLDLDRLRREAGAVLGAIESRPPERLGELAGHPGLRLGPLG
jgi:predicted metal-dependent hydrolase